MRLKIETFIDIDLTDYFDNIPNELEQEAYLVESISHNLRRSIISASEAKMYNIIKNNPTHHNDIDIELTSQICNNLKIKEYE